MKQDFNGFVFHFRAPLLVAKMIDATAQNGGSLDDAEFEFRVKLESTKTIKTLLFPLWDPTFSFMGSRNFNFSEKGHAVPKHQFFEKVGKRLLAGSPTINFRDEFIC